MGDSTKTRTFNCERWCAVGVSEIGRCFLALCEAWTFNENKIEPFRTRPLENRHHILNLSHDLCLISSNDSDISL